MKIRYTMLSVLMGATLFASAPLLANADALVVEPVVAETFFVTTYLNGGVGNGEEALMHRIAHEFPLRLTFSERKDGEFIVNVPVVIFDAKGNPVFELPNAGPMLYVILPDGKYKEGPDRVAGSCSGRQGRQGFVFSLEQYEEIVG